MATQQNAGVVPRPARLYSGPGSVYRLRPRVTSSDASTQTLFKTSSWWGGLLSWGGGAARNLEMTLCSGFITCDL